MQKQSEKPDYWLLSLILRCYVPMTSDLGKLIPVPNYIIDENEGQFMQLYLQIVFRCKFSDV
jgi:hypothetical protein